MKTIKKLQFTFGGYFANNYSVTIVGNKTEYWGSRHPINMKPALQKAITDEKLNELSLLLNQLEIQKWQPEYFAEIMDGIQWTLIILYSDKTKFKSFGSNAYPDSNGNKKDEMTNEFQQLMDILKSAIEEPDFFSSKFIN